MGLKKSQVKKYWNDRYEKQGGLACGYAGRKPKMTAVFQQRLLNERKQFFTELVPLGLHTLDYGCGVGAYACMFEQYIGVDVCKQAIEIARVNYPDKFFLHLENEFINDDTVSLRNPIQMIFTANVLQHCNDKLVEKIVGGWAKFTKPKTVVIYEVDNGKEVSHCVGRDSSVYVNCVHDAFGRISEWAGFTHTVHGEDHTLTIIEL